MIEKELEAKNWFIEVEHMYQKIDFLYKKKI